MSEVPAIQTGLDDLAGVVLDEALHPEHVDFRTHNTAGRYSVNSAATEGSRRRSDTDRRRRVTDG